MLSTKTIWGGEKTIYIARITEKSEAPKKIVDKLSCRVNIILYAIFSQEDWL
jgi:hypothetical protein